MVPSRGRARPYPIANLSCNDLLNPETLPFNQAKATKWHVEAAKNGNAPSQLEAGLRYQQGLGTEQNLSESAKYLKLAALNNITIAQYLYGEQLLQAWYRQKRG